MKLSVLALLLAVGSFAYAEKPADLPQCASIAKSCEAAGYQPGEHKKNGKGLWADCVHAIAKGKTVTGVTATQADAKACQEAAHAARRERREKRANKH
jgi:hypothetical protein